MSTIVERETGMLDVGSHCQFCRQIDFLPFHCSYCNNDFCASHRFKDDHRCTWLLEEIRKEHLRKEQKPAEKKHSKKKHKMTFFETLLPEKGYIRVNHA
ncbi:hypothetical protein TPHA_0F02080 [Tetrapisispora phaffii CBS 4417]|uniref:AN1-type domain-containing protein n=1 Tax=Tetrapisispora phaffii (strain ATCC 24235 / CBS 4417 / NBRC 1672 / NRRL Y-8282 / UCD 70-5) TaxID=1071381 RepID=G8BVA8_TETPH|nr:hypothetical protein TPHA_0F02080 [Tetrapisispora phaffii CBS 4417]CCE63690.1 hypothetical protein TPHA_0F02080 [Tetrapisispora phaffii CBS 4417]